MRILSEAELDTVQNEFRSNGYTIVRSAISSDELTDLRNETDAQIALGPERDPRGDFYIKEVPAVGPQFYRLEYTTDLEKSVVNTSMLLVTANPALHQAIQAVCAEPFLLCSTHMTFKGVGGGPAVELHRDDLPDKVRFDRRHLAFSVDIYLDDSTSDNGCLRAIPGSHNVEDVRGVLKDGMNAPGLRDIEANAGDIVLHDGLLVHGSPATGPGNSIRRTIYCVIQPIDWVAEEGYVPGISVTADWIGRNIKLMQEAIRRRQLRYPDQQAPEYRLSDRWQAQADTAELTTRPYPEFLDEDEAEAIRQEFRKHLAAT